MNRLRRRGLLVLCLAILAVAIYFIAAKQKQVPTSPSKLARALVGSAPENPFPDSAFKITNVEVATAEQNTRLTHQRIKQRAVDMTEQERAQFQKEFAEKIKPVIERWCNVYTGHISFRLEDITADKLSEIANLRSDAHGYDFMINGADLGIVDDAGKVFVDSLMAPAANDLFKVPTNPPPPAEGSVSKEEILRLLKADSGKDFPPDQIAIRPTGRSTAMNGGVSVDVGERVNASMMPLPKYAMVFGPDGNLVCYGRSDKPQ